MLIPTNSNYGKPGFQSEAVAAEPELLCGDTPAIVTIAAIVPAAIRETGLAKWTPVVVNFDTDEISMPEEGGRPNAITVFTVEAGVPEDSRVGVYKAGCFNVNALNYPEGVDTERAKLSHFDPNSMIVVKKPYIS